MRERECICVYLLCEQHSHHFSFSVFLKQHWLTLVVFLPQASLLQRRLYFGVTEVVVLNLFEQQAANELIHFEKSYTNLLHLTFDIFVE